MEVFPTIPPECREWRRFRALYCLRNIYHGPVINPGVELNIALGGRMLVDTQRAVEDALEESVELYYQPRNAGRRKRLVELFLHAQEAYFGQWDPQRFTAQCRSMSGELHITDLFGT